MSREEINFISSTWFNWKSDKDLNFFPNSKFKILYKNQKLNEITLLFKLSKNTLIKKPLVSKFDKEIYILSGSLEFSGNSLNKDFYTCIPAGFEKKLFSSIKGSIGIIFLKKQSSKSLKNNKFYPNFDHKQWVPRINAFEKIWPSPNEKLKSIYLNNSGARVNILREDKRKNISTFLLGFPPLWTFPEVKNLGGDIEIFLLNGKVNNSRGLMKSGSYMSIPKGTTLTSMYSKESAVFLIKSHGNSFFLKNIKNDMKFNFKDIVRSNNSIIPKKILSNIISGPYANIKL